MEFVWKIGGEAGFGIMGSGVMFAKVFTRKGYYAHVYSEYPSLIRGGHNTTQVRISDRKVESPRKKVDLVVALNKFAVIAHAKEITEKGGIIYDPEHVDLKDVEIPEYVQKYEIPLLKLAKEAGGDMLMRNTVAMGATLALIGYPIEVLENLISETFKRKGEEIVNINVNAARKGYEYVKENFKVEEFPHQIEVKEGKPKYVLTGNEAIGAGAIQAGLKLYCAYPMTPASSILHYVAKHEYDADVVVKHTEDEIAAINMAIGGMFAGVRSMTATSGGGFALMTEAVGLAALSETPLVVAVAQRVGPSTGMPTWTEQADLKFVLNASQGDFLRVILAPGDMAEAYELTQIAFNLAEKYQLPVFIMSDKFLSESYSAEDPEKFKKIPVERGKLIKEDMEPLPPREKFKRYAFTEDGISPRPIPGVRGGEHVGTSYEHRENSFSTEHFETRVKMVEKRNKKIELLAKELKGPTEYGDPNAEVVLVCWGSMKPVVFEAVDKLNEKGVKVKALHFSYVYPLPEKGIQQLKAAKKIIDVENNSSAQFAGILREFGGVNVDAKILRFDGRPLFAEEVAEHVEKIVKGEEKDVIVYDKEPVEYYTAEVL